MKFSKASISPAPRISLIRAAVAPTNSGARCARSSIARHQRERFWSAPRIRLATGRALMVLAVAAAPAWRQIFAAICAPAISDAIPCPVGCFRLISQNDTRQEGPALTSASASTPAAQPSSSSSSKRAARSSHASRNSGRSASRWRIMTCSRRTAPSAEATTCSGAGLGGGAHGMQASTAALSASRISGLSVIGSTMLERTAAASGNPARTSRPA